MSQSTSVTPQPSGRSSRGTWRFGADTGHRRR
jgi:hypothetical protein